MRLCIVLETETDSHDPVDPTEVTRQLDELLGNEEVASALGFTATVQDVYEADAGTRTRALHDLADALDRVGFDGLPEAIQPESSDDSEPLEVRLSLSVSATNFPSVAVDELLDALDRFGDGELEAIGAMGAISLFDAFGEDQVSPGGAYIIARNTAERLSAQIEAETEEEEPEEEEPEEEEPEEADHETELDEAQVALQEQLDERTQDDGKAN